MTPAPPRRLAQLDLALAILATATAALLLAVFLAHAPALWRDEVSSVNTQSVETFGEMWRLSEFESFPALWMVLLRAWIQLGGSSDASLRVFGLLGPTALIAGVWFAGRRLGLAAPVVSLALVATNPDILRWTATLRPWGLGTGLALVTVPLVWDATRTPTRRRVLLAGLAAILSVQCLFQNAVLLAAVVAGCLAVSVPRRAWRSAAVAVSLGIGGVISLLPYVGVIRRRADWNALGAFPVTVGDLWDRLVIVAGAGRSVSATVWIILVAAAFVTGVAAVLRRVRSTDARGDEAGLYAVVVAASAAIGILTLYRVLQYPTQAWYYIGLLALVAVCAEVALVRLVGAATVRLAALVAATLLLLAGTAPVLVTLQVGQTNVDRVAAHLHDAADPHDLIVANPWFVGVTLGRYYRGPCQVDTVPPIEDRRVSRYDLLKRQMMLGDPLAPLFARMRQALATGHRVWLVGNYELPPRQVSVENFTLPPPPLPDRGWAAAPYEYLWSMQVGVFLRDHATTMEVVALDGRGRPIEDAGLRAFSGWRSDPQGPPTSR